jgi:hypothetical protein
MIEDNGSRLVMQDGATNYIGAKSSNPANAIRSRRMLDQSRRIARFRRDR